MLRKLEQYILKVCRLRNLFNPIFLKVYATDIHRLMEYYTVMRVIEDGLNPFNTYRIMLKSYNWSFEKYQHITAICLYLNLIEEEKPGQRMSNVRIRSGKELITYQQRTNELYYA